MYHKRTCRRILGILVLTIVLTCLCGCGDKQKESEEPQTFELALITDESGVNDGSFLQDTWQSMQSFAEENEMTFQTYESPNDADSYLKTINKAQKKGAKFVALAGSQFETVAFEAQKKYEDLSFVLIDGVPRDEDYNYDAAGNTIGVLFAEEQAGYLAGYAAVCEGYTKLGFMGGNPVPPVKRYGYGFIQGASAAAKEMSAGQIDIKYEYLGTFEASDEIESESYSWFQDGTQVIFACGGSIGESVMAAAETAGGKVIGVDADQSSLSETVIMSAVKQTGRAMTDILKTYKRHNFQGGAILNYSAENDGIGLAMAPERMTKFTQEMYDTLYKEIRKGTRSIDKDIEHKKPGDVAGDGVNVEEVDQ